MVISAAVVGPRVVVVHRVVVVVAVAARRRVPRRAPHQRHGLAVDRHEHDPAGANVRAQVPGGPEPECARELDADSAHPGVVQGAFEMRSVGALGQPESPAP